MRKKRLATPHSDLSDKMHMCELLWDKTNLNYLGYITEFMYRLKYLNKLIVLFFQAVHRTLDAHLCSNLSWCLILTTRWGISPCLGLNCANLLIWVFPPKKKKGIFIGTFQSSPEFHSVFSLTFLPSHRLFWNLSLLLFLSVALAPLLQGQTSSTHLPLSRPFSSLILSPQRVFHTGA